MHVTGLTEQLQGSKKYKPTTAYEEHSLMPRQLYKPILVKIPSVTFE
jgi:hypothetical protein